MNKIDFDCYAKNGEVQIVVLADCDYGNNKRNWGKTPTLHIPLNAKFNVTFTKNRK